MKGWQSLEMVQKYAHLAPEHLVKDAIKIDSIMTGDCHNLGTVNKSEEEVITVDTMRKILKDMEENGGLMVGRERFERSTNGLKVRCSTD
jgi:hypothetical protein